VSCCYKDGKKKKRKRVWKGIDWNHFWGKKGVKGRDQILAKFQGLIEFGFDGNRVIFKEGIDGGQGKGGGRG